MQNNHVCVANNLQQPCTVCGEVLFDTVLEMTVLACGHTIHSHCHEALIAANFPACPLCLRTEADREATQALVEEAEARLLALQQSGALPPVPLDAYSPATASASGSAVRVGRSIHRFCGACRHRIRTSEHAFGDKCPDCGSFCC